jgi:hypothetical protein
LALAALFLALLGALFTPLLAGAVTVATTAAVAILRAVEDRGAIRNVERLRLRVCRGRLDSLPGRLIVEGFQRCELGRVFTLRLHGLGRPGRRLLAVLGLSLTCVLAFSGLLRLRLPGRFALLLGRPRSALGIAGGLLLAGRSRGVAFALLRRLLFGRLGLLGFRFFAFPGLRLCRLFGLGFRLLALVALAFGFAGVLLPLRLGGLLLPLRLGGLLFGFRLGGLALGRLGLRLLPLGGCRFLLGLGLLAPFARLRLAFLLLLPALRLFGLASFRLCLPFLPPLGFCLAALPFRLGLLAPLPGLGLFLLSLGLSLLPLRLGLLLLPLPFRLLGLFRCLALASLRLGLPAALRAFAPRPLTFPLTRALAQFLRRLFGLRELNCSGCRCGRSG